MASSAEISVRAGAFVRPTLSWDLRVHALRRIEDKLAAAVPDLPSGTGGDR